MYLISVIDGPRKGGQIQVRDGWSVTIGRQANTQFAVPGDYTMSGTHCTIAHNADRGLTLTDEGSSNGTFVDGERIHAARVRTGQRFHAGASEFLIQFFPSFGSWIIPAIPPGWTEIPGRGIQVVQTGRFPTNIVFAEEKHPLEIPLSEFIRRQRLIARESIPHAVFAPPMSVRAAEADEAYVVGAEFEAAGGAKARQRELYVCRLGIAGSVSMTTIDPESPHVDRMFDAVMAKARFLPRPLGC